MKIILKALLHKANGTHVVSDLPELRGMKFQTEKELEKFKRKKLKEIFGENSPYLKDDNKRADIICQLVTTPEGIDDLPPNWRPCPVQLTELVQNVRPQSPSAQPLEEIIPFEWRKPKFKNQTKNP